MSEKNVSGQSRCRGRSAPLLRWLDDLPTCEVTADECVARCEANALESGVGRGMTGLAASGAFDVLLGGAFVRVAA